jgi:hypothetical protein
MRKLVAALVVGMGMMGFGSQALAYDDFIESQPEVDKFERGATNFAFGIPDEVITHTIGGVVGPSDSLGEWFGNTVTGVVTGLFWGAGRMGSGFIDMVTFPFSVNEDDKAFVPPDHHI